MAKIQKLPQTQKFKFCPLCKHCLSRKHIDGHERLVCEKCGWIYYGNPLPVAVCAAIDNEGKILIAKRNLNPGINQWALPGGFIESDETPETACLRELKEETGLKGKIKRLVGVYVQNTKEYGALIIIGYEVVVSRGLLSLNSELKEARFFCKKDAPFIPFSSHKKILNKVFKDI